MVSTEKNHLFLNISVTKHSLSIKSVYFYFCRVLHMVPGKIEKLNITALLTFELVLIKLHY